MQSLWCKIGYLKNHLRMKHGVKVNRVFICDLCKKNFDDKDELTAHMSKPEAVILPIDMEVSCK